MSSRIAKRDKLKQLREARQAGSSLIHTVHPDEVGGIYDEVDEETYREHKRNQLMNDDFIVDDDGEGYVDNGVDEWDDSTRPKYYSDEDDDEITSGKKRKRRDKKPVKVTKTAQISNFFKTTNNQAPAKKIEANIDDILDDFQDVTPESKKKKNNNTNIFSSSSKSTARNKSKGVFDFTSVKKEKPKKLESDDFEDLSLNLEDQPSSPIKTERINAPFSTEESEKENVDPVPVTKEDPDIEDEIESDDDSDEDIVITRRPRASAATKANTATFSSIKASTLPSSSPLKATSHSVISHTDKLDESKIVNKDDESDSFKMFWLDYCEVDSTLLLFGKIQTKDGELVSGIVQVNNLCRELFFLPRKYRLVDGEEDIEDPISPINVHEEIAPLLLEKYDLEELKAMPQSMKYAFELTDIPKSTEYLKVLLPYKTPKNKNLIMPANLEGETFNHVFGTNSNIFESFVLQANIMGPCWLEICNGDFNAIQNTSHCQVEVSVSSVSCIKPITEQAPSAPNLTVTSIAVQTVLNTKLNKQEVVSVSLATFRDLPQDAPIDENLQPNDIITLVRPVGSVSVPPALKQLAQKSEMPLRILPNEKVLLNCLSALIKNIDPDVFVGHRLENISLDVLVHRMYDLKVSTWSTFGRRNRKSWPDKFGRNSTGFNNNLQIREIFQGRLLCDIANEMGQSLTPKCQSWDLPEMYEITCNKKLASLEINYQNGKYAEDANFLLMALKDNSSNVKITAEIAFSIQILSLSKQLTNIAGNAWSHTLSGTRAGRNEFILLHEFKRNNYIVPDKEDRYHKNTTQQDARLETAEEDSTTATSNKKPKYQGGLVFEPEKGLHKNYVLVMDFNSLYPSIIQEFNICFTTVDRDQFNVTLDEDRDMPGIPERDSLPGVLPKLLNTLVTRRREVKKLLKNPNNTAFERAQYDIKQQALKLTANSMYGCLGYVNSRFYAKPLAMLVTNKGREILMDTRQLAESIGLRVVYGDTDSVMIDTGVDTFAEAIKIGEQFKIQVNERYKLLEIDIDNVFKRLLLHAKKKYAAMTSIYDRKSGSEKTSLEVKGLDMKRREYCQLSKDISTFVLEKVLSDLDPEIALSDIYDYLEEMCKKIKENEINADKYKINTRLSKDPKNYPNGKNMPPVQVALRLRDQGKVIKAGSVVTFVITSLANENDKSTPAERARPIQELLNKDTSLKPDPTYYLEKQIFAPVERLVERIEGVDMMRIANSLGIDTKKYILRVKNETGNGEILPLESSVTDAERFRQSSYLVLECKCGNKFRFGGILASNEYKVTFNGICCAKCNFTFPLIKLTSQLENVLRTHIALYYAGWLVCDDSACGIATRQISVYGKRCIGSSGKAYGCKGIMRYKYSDSALYNQLLYFSAIFDVDKAKKNDLKPLYDITDDVPSIPKLASGQVDALAEQNRDMFCHCQDIVQKYLSDCGRRYVDMSSIFDFMTISK